MSTKDHKTGTANQPSKSSSTGFLWSLAGKSKVKMGNRTPCKRSGSKPPNQMV